MTTIRFARTALAFAIVIAATVTSAGAQTNDEVFLGLQWNFSTPGARANGMGRSFIGVADDATAAVTNPAGLLNLTRPQTYGEYKNTQLKTDRLASITSLQTLQPTTFESTVNSLSFLSASLPINSKLAAGFSIQRFLDYHEVYNIAARRVPGTPDSDPRFFFPVNGNADFTATSFGGSVAYAVMPSLKVGVTIAGNMLKADSDQIRTDFVQGPTFRSNPNDVVPSAILANQTSIHDKQNAISATIGVLYTVNDMVSAGFTYDRSPRFNTSVNYQFNPGYRTPPGTTGTNQPLQQGTGFPKAVAINVPDRFGGGVAVRPIPKLLIAADAVRINYSSLTKSTTIIFNLSLTGNEYVTPDVTELHAGAEYNVYSVNGNPIFVRGGVFTNPNHQSTFTGNTDSAFNQSQAIIFNTLPGKDETRGTAGVGIALGPRAQADAAYVFGKEFVLSAAIRF
jgi:long-subunit fatty acid transport protein